MSDPRQRNRLIEETGTQKQKIASELGLTMQGLLNKLKGERPFQLAEIKPLCEVLHLTNEQRANIFLS